MRIVQAEECTRAACEELAAARQHAAQLENGARAREREVERLTKQLGQSRGAETSTEAQRALVRLCCVHICFFVCVFVVCACKRTACSCVRMCWGKAH